jgi:hypothetical protein
MDTKTITAVSTTFALFQIQLNALLLLLQQQFPNVPIREEFHRITNEGVQAAGLETMESIKKQLIEAIAQEQRPDQSNGKGRG